jgi:hypothetical protein
MEREDAIGFRGVLDVQEHGIPLQIPQDIKLPVDPVLPARYQG